MRSYDLGFFVIIFCYVAISFNTLEVYDVEIIPPGQYEMNTTSYVEKLAYKTGFETIDNLIQTGVYVYTSFDVFVNIFSDYVINLEDFLVYQIFGEDSRFIAEMIVKVATIVAIVGMIIFISGRGSDF